MADFRSLLPAARAYDRAVAALPSPEERQAVVEEQLAASSNAFERGLRAAHLGEQANEMAYKSEELAAQNKPAAADYWRGQALRRASTAGMANPNMPTFLDAMQGRGSLSDWGASMAAQGLHSSVQPMVGAVTGALAGAPLGPVGSSLGAAVGAFKPASSLMADEAAMTGLRDPESAKINPLDRLRSYDYVGAASGMLDALVPGHVATTLAKPLARRAAGEAVEGVGVVDGILNAGKQTVLDMPREALTEMGQTKIGQIGHSYLNPERDTSMDTADLFEAGAGGAAGTGGFAGVRMATPLAHGAFGLARHGISGAVDAVVPFTETRDKIKRSNRVEEAALAGVDQNDPDNAQYVAAVKTAAGYRNAEAVTQAGQAGIERLKKKLFGDDASLTFEQHMEKAERSSDREWNKAVVLADSIMQSDKALLSGATEADYETRMAPVRTRMRAMLATLQNEHDLSADLRQELAAFGDGSQLGDDEATRQKLGSLYLRAVAAAEKDAEFSQMLDEAFAAREREQAPRQSGQAARGRDARHQQVANTLTEQFGLDESSDEIQGLLDTMSSSLFSGNQKQTQLFRTKLADALAGATDDQGNPLSFEQIDDYASSLLAQLAETSGSKRDSRRHATAKLYEKLKSGGMLRGEIHEAVNGLIKDSDTKPKTVNKITGLLAALIDSFASGERNKALEADLVSKLQQFGDERLDALLNRIQLAATIEHGGDKKVLAGIASLRKKRVDASNAESALAMLLKQNQSAKTSPAPTDMQGPMPWMGGGAPTPNLAGQGEQILRALVAAKLAMRRGTSLHEQETAGMRTQLHAMAKAREEEYGTDSMESEAEKKLRLEMALRAAETSGRDTYTQGLLDLFGKKNAGRADAIVNAYLGELSSNSAVKGGSSAQHEGQRLTNEQRQQALKEDADLEALIQSMADGGDADLNELAAERAEQHYGVQGEIDRAPQYFGRNNINDVENTAAEPGLPLSSRAEFTFDADGNVGFDTTRSSRQMRDEVNSKFQGARTETVNPGRYAALRAEEMLKAEGQEGSLGSIRRREVQILNEMADEQAKADEQQLDRLARAKFESPDVTGREGGDEVSSALRRFEELRSAVEEEMNQIRQRLAIFKSLKEAGHQNYGERFFAHDGVRRAFHFIVANPATQKTLDIDDNTLVRATVFDTPLSWINGSEKSPGIQAREGGVFSEDVYLNSTLPVRPRGKPGEKNTSSLTLDLPKLVRHMMRHNQPADILGVGEDRNPNGSTYDKDGSMHALATLDEIRTAFENTIASLLASDLLDKTNPLLLNEGGKLDTVALTSGDFGDLFTGKGSHNIITEMFGPELVVYRNPDSGAVFTAGLLYGVDEVDAKGYVHFKQRELSTAALEKIILPKGTGRETVLARPDQQWNGLVPSPTAGGVTTKKGGKAVKRMLRRETAEKPLSAEVGNPYVARNSIADADGEVFSFSPRALLREMLELHGLTDGEAALQKGALPKALAAVLLREGIQLLEKKGFTVRTAIGSQRNEALNNVVLWSITPNTGEGWNVTFGDIHERELPVVTIRDKDSREKRAPSTDAEREKAYTEWLQRYGDVRSAAGSGASRRVRELTGEIAELQLKYAGLSKVVKTRAYYSSKHEYETLSEQQRLREKITEKQDELKSALTQEAWATGAVEDADHKALGMSGQEMENARIQNLAADARDETGELNMFDASLNGLGGFTTDPDTGEVMRRETSSDEGKYSARETWKYVQNIVIEAKRVLRNKEASDSSKAYSAATLFNLLTGDLWQDKSVIVSAIDGLIRAKALPPSVVKTLPVEQQKVFIDAVASVTASQKNAKTAKNETVTTNQGLKIKSKSERDPQDDAAATVARIAKRLTAANSKARFKEEYLDSADRQKLDAERRARWAEQQLIIKAEVIRQRMQSTRAAAAEQAQHTLRHEKDPVVKSVKRKLQKQKAVAAKAEKQPQAPADARTPSSEPAPAAAAQPADIREVTDTMFRAVQTGEQGGVELTSAQMTAYLGRVKFALNNGKADPQLIVDLIKRHYGFAPQDRVQWPNEIATLYKHAHEAGGGAQLGKSEAGQTAGQASRGTMNDLRTDTDEVRERVAQSVARRLGEAFKAVFGDVLTDSDGNPVLGWFQQNQKAAQKLLEISAFAPDPDAIAAHEAWHAMEELLRGLGPAGQKIVETIYRAASSPLMIAKFRQKFGTDKDVMADIERDAAERAAYMFQLYASGEKLPMGASASLFGRIKAFFGRLLNLTTDMAKTKQFFQFFDSGVISKAITETGNPEVVLAAMRETWMDRQSEKLSKVFAPVTKSIKAFFQHANNRVYEMKIAQFSEIAKRVDNGFGGAAGYQEEWKSRYISAANRYSEIVEGLDDNSKALVMSYLDGQTDVPEAAKTVGEAILGIVREMQKMRKSVGLTHDPALKTIPLSFNPEAIYGKTDAFEKALRAGSDAMAKLSDADMSAIIAQIMHDGYYDGELPLFQRNEAQARAFLSTDLDQRFLMYAKMTARQSAWAALFPAREDEALLSTGGKSASLEQRNYMRKFIAATRGQLGRDMNPFTRQLFGATIAGANMLLLPLAVFSQLIEPLQLAFRKNSLRGVGRSYWRGIRDLTRAFKNTTHARDDMERLTLSLGLVGNSAITSLMADVYSDLSVHGKINRFNQTFFRFNLMESWHRSMNVAAVQNAIEFLIENTLRPGKHSTRFLSELGLTPTHVKLALRDGELDTTRPEIRKAILTFVDQSLAHPNTSTNAMWMNDPHFALIAHLKRFTWAHSQNILHRASTEAFTHKNYAALLPIALAVPFMGAVDFVKYGITMSPVDDNWSFFDWLGHSMARVSLGRTFGTSSDLWGSFEQGHYGVDALAPSAAILTGGGSLLGLTIGGADVLLEMRKNKRQTALYRGKNNPPR